MNKLLSLLLLAIVLPLIQLHANDHIMEEGTRTISQVNFFSTTQIVCPLNATSFPATIDVPIKVTGFNNIISTQGSISWDTSVIKFGYISSYGTAPSFANTVFSPNPAGYLTFNWSTLNHSGISVADSAFFCTIRFTINGTFGNSSKITLSNNPLPFKTIDSNNNIIPTYYSNGTVILTNGSSVNISSPTSFCQGDSALLSSSLGTSYQWYYNSSPISGATYQTYLAYNTGVYSVLTTLSNGCNTYSSNINITANPAPQTPVITSNTPTTTCAGGNIILTSSTGNLYQWYLNGTPIAGGNSQSFTASASGRYTVITTNTSGCSSSVSAAVQVSFNTLPPTPVITSKGSVTFCSNTYDTLICSSGSGYQWYLNGSPISGANNQMLVVNSTGNYTVTTSNNSCVSIASSVIAINVTNVLQPVINITGTTNLCPGNTVVLSSNNTYNYYQWYLNGSPIVGANYQTFTASMSGNYTLQAGFAGGCMLLSAPVTVTSISVVTPSLTASGSTTLCTGSSVILNCSNNGYNTYQWYINGSAISNATNSSFTANSTGLYTVQVSTTTGCKSTTTAGINVVVNPVPSPPTVTSIGSVNLCAGSSLTLISSSSSNYQWNNNGIPINNAVAQSNVVTTAGSYTVSAINSFGCSANSQPVVVTVIPKTTPVITAGGNISFCQGGSVQLNASSGYTTYQWYLNNILITNAISAGYLTTVAGNYTVVGTTSDGCTSNASAITTVTVYSKPSTPVLSTNNSTTICAGSSITLNSSVEYTYTWYLNAALLNTTTNPSINITSAGNYTVLTTNANGCNSANSNSINVIVTNPVVPTITTTGNTTICNGDSILIKTAAIGNAYQWYFNGIALNNTNSQSIYANSNGNYSVSVTYPSGCTATSSPFGITVYNSPTPVITGNNILCPGTTITLSATAGFNAYQWYKGGIPVTGATLSSYTTSVTGNFTVIGTNTSGCNSAQSQPIQITAGSTPSTPVITNSGNTTFCPGGSVILTSNNNNYNNYQWYLNGNVFNNSSQSITANTAGTYTVTATNNAGCVSAKSNTVSVSIYPVPVTPVIYNSTNSDSLCLGNSLILSTSLQSSYQWYLNGNPINNETGQYYTVSAGGNYSVTITNWVGCVANSLPATIVIIPKSTPLISALGNTAFCKGANVQLSTAGYSSYQWYNNNVAIKNATTASITPDSAGNYSVVGTSSLGCISY
ncbi:MAG: immunoglobulin domain-containing protein, partial [Bacteroidota bacterium]